MPQYEYKIEIIQENAWGTIFLGASVVPLEKMEQAFNVAGLEGWKVAFQVVESRRFWLFWSREAVIVTYVREKGSAPASSTAPLQKSPGTL